MFRLTKNKNPEFTQAILLREQKIEHSINHFRFGILAFFILMDSISFTIFNGFDIRYVSLFATSLLVLMVLFGIARKVMQKKYRFWMKYMSIFFDFSIFFVGSFFFVDEIKKMLPVDISQLGIFVTIVFIFFNMLSALRSSKKAIYFSTIVSFIFNLAILYQMDMHVFILVYTSIFIAISGILSLWVSDHIIENVLNNLALRKANFSIEQKNEELQSQKDKIDQSNTRITDSIRYAKRIQDAILPNEKILNEALSDYFIYFNPHDIVSGDFYWMRKIGRKIIIVAADCTGHGVPGAFMSMLGISQLNEITSFNIENQKEVIQREHAKNGIYYEFIEQNLHIELSAAEILDRLRNTIKKSLHQTGTFDEQKDGMDLALVIFDTQKRTLQYAGANNALYYVRKSSDNEQYELNKIKADHQPIGIYLKEKNFTNHELEVHDGDSFYLFSDGYVDQFGGKNGEKFKNKRFRELLLSFQEKTMAEQKIIIEETFEKWQANYNQIDDVLVMGIRV